MARRYAQDTKVSVSRSQDEIRRLVEGHGATEYIAGWTSDGEAILFSLNGHRVRLFVTATGDEREQRRRWRVQLILVKTKLEAIADEQSTVEREFMADLVLPGGRTVGERVLPALAGAYEEGGALPPLLPSG